MTAEPDLLPCPWCGGEAVDTQAIGGGYYYATCRKASCGIGPDAATSAEAIASWNTRVAHATAAKDAEIEALRAEVERLREVSQQVARMAGANNLAAVEAETRAERLVEALDELADEWEDNGWPDPASALRSAVAALDPTAAQEGNDHG